MDHLQKTITEDDELKGQTHRTKRILLIGNDKNNELSTIIEHEGYQLIRCRSVHQAWEAVYPCRPDFIVLRLDKTEPRALSEFQECHVLAEGIPIIVTTADYVSASLMHSLRHRGAVVLAASAAAQNLGPALRHEDVIHSGSH